MAYLKSWKNVNYEFYICQNYKNGGEIKTFQDTQKLRELVPSTLAIQETLKRILQVEMVGSVG